MSERDPYIVPGLIRGLAALRSFTPHRPEQSLGDIASALGITRSAAFRTVHTLVATGHLLEIPGKARYRLGPQVLGLSYGLLASRELLEVAQGPLEALRDELNWSTHLGILDGRHVLYLIRFPATDGLSSLVHVGSRLPATQTAMGRLLLSRKSEPELRRLMEGRPEAELNATLAHRRTDCRSDIVKHEGQFEDGLCSVAAPVTDMSGEAVAAISATKTARTIDANIQMRTEKTALSISRGLGA